MRPERSGSGRFSLGGLSGTRVRANSGREGGSRSGSELTVANARSSFPPLCADGPFSVARGKHQCRTPGHLPRTCAPTSLRSPHHTSSRSKAFLASLVLPTLLIGCSSGPTLPFEPEPGSNVLGRSQFIAARDLPSSRGFYPLAVGNRWHYSRLFVVSFGSGISVVSTSVDREIVGTEVREDRTYFVEEERGKQDSRPGDGYKFWTRYRQDQFGLYYGGHSRREVPRAYRVRVSSPDDGPEHLALVWYGRAGLPAQRIHVESADAGYTAEETEMIYWLSISH